jgi:hypothetical protein
MINKLYLIILIILLSISSTKPWGEEGHKLICRKAIEMLPVEMSFFQKWKDYLSEHSIDPDVRRDKDKSEWPKHFIDIDFYPEFLKGQMNQDKEQLFSLYGDSVVTKIGLLPWATEETFQDLVHSFKEKNRDKILIFISDLAHYVADSHQPMHTILNYDGQLTNQKGIHYRYESIMIDKYLNEIEDSYDSAKVLYVKEPLSFIFNYITESNSVSSVLFDADNFAFKNAGSKENDEYYKLLWFRTKYISEIQFHNASKALASLIYTAWIDAGSPHLNDAN